MTRTQINEYKRKLHELTLYELLEKLETELLILYTSQQETLLNGCNIRCVLIEQEIITRCEIV